MNIWFFYSGASHLKKCLLKSKGISLLKWHANAVRPGRPPKADVDKIKSFVNANRRITTREIAERLNLPNAIVHKHNV